MGEEQAMSTVGSIGSNYVNAMAGIGGTVVAGLFGNAQQKKQMEYNAAQAAINRDWQSEQAEIQRGFSAEEAQKARDYNTEMWNKQNEYNSPEAQYQRLMALGINPQTALSMMNEGSAGNAGGIGSTAMQGSASLPSGSQAAPYESISNGMANLIGRLPSSIVEMANAWNESEGKAIDNIWKGRMNEAQWNSLRADARKAASEAKVNEYNVDKLLPIARDMNEQQFKNAVLTADVMSKQIEQIDSSINLNTIQGIKLLAEAYNVDISSMKIFKELGLVDELIKTEESVQAKNWSEVGVNKETQKKIMQEVIWQGMQNTMLSYKERNTISSNGAYNGLDHSLYDYIGTALGTISDAAGDSINNSWLNHQIFQPVKFVGNFLGNGIKKGFAKSDEVIWKFLTGGFGN